MLREAYYYRDASFLYRLQSHPSYWFHVGRSEATQVIMGLLGEKFCVIVFSEMGDLIQVQEQPVVVPPSSSSILRGLDWLSEQINLKVAQVRKDLCLADEVVRVKRFRLPGLQAGIEDLPDDLQEYLANRGLSSRTEDDLEAAVQGWKEESLFAFWWNECLYVSDKGEVTSS